MNIAEKPVAAARAAGRAGGPLIDIYTHIYPDRFFQAMSTTAPQLENLGKRLRSVKKLFDLDERFREMDEYRRLPADHLAAQSADRGHRQGRDRLELARIANDSMAELAARHPDRFPAFAAALSLTDIDGSLEEAQRAIDELGAPRRPDLHQHRGRAARRSENSRRFLR